MCTEDNNKDVTAKPDFLEPLLYVQPDATDMCGWYFITATVCLCCVETNCMGDNFMLIGQWESSSLAVGVV